MTLEEYYDSILENCLEMELTEEQFWSMTIAEITRYIRAYNKRHKRELQERAMFDYKLAILCGNAVNHAKGTEFPELEKYYSGIFDESDYNQRKERQAQQRAVLQFKQFAQFHNKNYGGDKH